MIAALLAVVPLLNGFGVPAYGQPSAALWKDQLFVAINSYRGPAALYRGAFVADERRVRHPAEYDNPCGRSPSSQARLNIRDDRILLYQRGNDDHYIFKMADLPWLEISEFGDKLREVRGYKSLGEFECWFCGGTADLLFPEHRDPDVPVERPPPGVYDFPERKYLETARYSLQIAGPKSVRLFHAHKDRLFVSVEPDYLNTWYRDKDGNIAKNLPKPPDRQLRTGKLPAEFTEHFAAYTAGGRDYLVTTNGEVYVALPKGKTEVEVTAVWNDPKRKIAGVVQDPDNDAVYGWGFVTDSQSPERFYVKMDPKPVAKLYKLTVPLWNDRDDAYLESYECARAFRASAPKK